MNIENDNPLAELIQTTAEVERRELANRMLAFASENLQQISDTELLAGSPLDWDDAKKSLLQHPAISKSVRIAASTCAQERYFHLHKFEIMRPATYLDEVLAAIKQGQDLKIREQLDFKLRVHIQLAESTPGIRKVLWDDARTYRRNTVIAIKEVIKFCQSVVTEWLELIPAENFLELQNDLDQLSMAELSTQLKWFGLGEFIED